MILVEVFYAVIVTSKSEIYGYEKKFSTFLSSFFFKKANCAASLSLHFLPYSSPT